MTFEPWDPLDVWPEWQEDKKTKDKNTEIKKGKGTERELGIVMSGQFHTLVNPFFPANKTFVKRPGSRWLCCLVAWALLTWQRMPMCLWSALTWTCQSRAGCYLEDELDQVVRILYLLTQRQTSPRHDTPKKCACDQFWHWHVGLEEAGEEDEIFRQRERSIIFLEIYREKWEIFRKRNK